MIAVAETQFGYSESERNFDAVLNDDRDAYILKGWTRYGAWYGIPYGDWCAMFVSFCLHYAGITDKEYPYDCATTTWVRSLEEKELFSPASEYSPMPGDLVFFDWETGRPDGSCRTGTAGWMKRTIICSPSKETTAGRWGL